MKNFKNLKSHQQAGLTFIEVVLAIFIIGSVLSATLLLQSSSLYSIAHYSARFARIIMLENALDSILRSHAMKEKATVAPKQEIKEPATTITYTNKGPSEKSSLKSFENIIVHRLNAQWQLLESDQEEQLVMLLYTPKKNYET